MNDVTAQLLTIGVAGLSLLLSFGRVWVLRAKNETVNNYTERKNRVVDERLDLRNRQLVYNLFTDCNENLKAVTQERDDLRSKNLELMKFEQLQPLLDQFGYDGVYDLLTILKEWQDEK